MAEDLTIPAHIANLPLSRMDNLIILTTAVDLLLLRTEDLTILTVVDLLVSRTEDLIIPTHVVDLLLSRTISTHQVDLVEYFMEIFIRTTIIAILLQDGGFTSKLISTRNSYVLTTSTA